MNKMHYPEKDEINRQINIILDQSGLFEDTKEEYTEFIPERKNFSPKMIMLPVAAAAVLLAGIAVVHYEPAIRDINRSGSAMTSVDNDDTFQETYNERMDLNDRLHVEMDMKTATVQDEWNGKNVTIATVQYLYPTVYDREEVVDVISEYFQENFEKIQEQIKAEYAADKYASYFERRNAEEEVPVTVKITNKVVTGVSAWNESIVTVVQTAKETIAYQTEPVTKTTQAGFNFDVANNAMLEFSDVVGDLTQQEKPYREMLTKLYQKSAATSTLHKQLEKYISRESALPVKEPEILAEIAHVCAQGNWYLSSSGILIFMKDTSTQNGQTAYTESFVIPYEDFAGLNITVLRTR